MIQESPPGDASSKEQQLLELFASPLQRPLVDHSFLTMITPQTPAEPPPPCQHKAVMKDLCIDCGIDIRTLSDAEQRNILSEATVSMVHTVPELKVSVDLAEKLGHTEQESLVKSRKLVLLVDLDQTIIHTTNDGTGVQSNTKDLYSFQLYPPGHPLHSNHPSNTYHTKLRPHVVSFLKNVSTKYQMHICTFGSRMYAHTIAKIIEDAIHKEADTSEPMECNDEVADVDMVSSNQKGSSSSSSSGRKVKAKIFEDRILSRDECLDPMSKTGNLRSLFPVGDKMVAIIDDREDVWNFSSNVIAVKPYHYFKNTGDINNPFSNMKSSGQQSCLLGMGKDIENISDKTEDETSDSNKSDSKDKEPPVEKPDVDDDNDDYLLYLEDILSNVHKQFFDEYDDKNKHATEEEIRILPDLKVIIPGCRRKTLANVSIVFSGIIPTNVQQEKHRMFQMAKLLGANITKDVMINTEGASPLEVTTHVIGAKYWTEKIKKAVKYNGKLAKSDENKKRNQIYVVNPHWLTTCFERWERVNEQLFLLKETDDFQIKDNIKSKPGPSAGGGGDQSNDLPIAGCSSSAGGSSSSKPVIEIPVYDPVTGKRINKKNDNAKTEIEISRRSRKESETIEEPIMFSSNEILSMGKEVEDACSEGSEDLSDDDDDTNDETAFVEATKKRVLDNVLSDDDEDSFGALEADAPKGWKKLKGDGSKDATKKCETLPLEEGEESTNDNDGVGISSESDDGDDDDDDSDESLDKDAAFLEQQFLNS